VEKPVETIKYVDRVVEKQIVKVVEDDSFKQDLIHQYDKIVADKLFEISRQYEADHEKEKKRLTMMIYEL